MRRLSMDEAGRCDFYNSDSAAPIAVAYSALAGSSKLMFLFQCLL
ncbi:MAG: hypothetical protein ABFC28_02220 [Rikenellaceae bacterium]